MFFLAVLTSYHLSEERVKRTVLTIYKIKTGIPVDERNWTVDQPRILGRTVGLTEIHQPNQSLLLPEQYNRPQSSTLNYPSCLRIRRDNNLTSYGCPKVDQENMLSVRRKLGKVSSS